MKAELSIDQTLAAMADKLSTSPVRRVVMIDRLSSRRNNRSMKNFNLFRFVAVFACR